jgi:hypothetical protein
LAPNAVHDVIGWPAGPSLTKKDAQKFYESMFADLSESKVTTVKRLYGENFLIDESVWEGKAPGKPFGFEGYGRPLKFRLLHVMEFNDDGQIRREQVWVDLAAIGGQLPQKRGVI